MNIDEYFHKTLICKHYYNRASFSNDVTIGVLGSV